MSNPGQIVDQTINGTYGKVWVDGNLIAEVETFELNIEIENADVNVAGSGATYKKQVGWSGTGSMAVKHVNSRHINRMADSIKAGKTVRSTIVGTVADPGASGRETITVRDVTFNGLQLLKFELKTVTMEDIPFNFSDFDKQDTIA